MIRAMELKDFSLRTQQSYLAAVKGVANFHGKSPDRLTQIKVEEYLLHLKKSGKSASTRNVVISGLRFFYHNALEDKSIARGTADLPEGLSAERLAVFYHVKSPLDFLEASETHTAPWEDNSDETGTMKMLFDSHDHLPKPFGRAPFGPSSG